MTTERYHDVVQEDIEGIAFLAHNALLDYSFLWWTKYSLAPEVSYWWNEFDRCNVQRYMLFTDQGQCSKFSKVSAAHGIDPECCIVVPPSLYDNFVHTRHVRIIHDVYEDEAVLSIMSAHYSKPEST